MISIRQAAEISVTSNDTSRWSALRFNVDAFSGNIEDAPSQYAIGGPDPGSVQLFERRHGGVEPERLFQRETRLPSEDRISEIIEVRQPQPSTGRIDRS